MTHILLPHTLFNKTWEPRYCRVAKNFRYSDNILHEDLLNVAVKPYICLISALATCVCVQLTLYVQSSHWLESKVNSTAMTVMIVNENHRNCHESNHSHSANDG